MSLAIREATPSDLDFLVEMLTEAIDWTGDRGISNSDVWQRPDLAHYVADWPRTGEIGMVATEHDRPIGAVWLRYLDANDPGYGYVADDIPELSIAVIPSMRGLGLGRAMMGRLVERARALGIPAISLSVERANQARNLYLDIGFVIVASGADTDTMLFRLS